MPEPRLKYHLIACGRRKRDHYTPSRDWEGKPRKAPGVGRAALGYGKGLVLLILCSQTAASPNREATEASCSGEPG